MIKVIKPGIHSTIQDRGRFGYYEKGIPPSGAMDLISYSIGNFLVGNFNNEASLEITYAGPTLEFLNSYTIAITGGNMPPRINGEIVPMWETISVKKGDILSFDFIKEGARTYISVSGGFKVPSVLNSKSTYILSKIGGYKGRILIEGDILEVESDNYKKIKEGTKIPEKLIPKFSSFQEIRIIDGLCSYRISEESKRILSESEWTITPDANRVGYRIRGGELEFIERVQPFGAGNSQSNVVDVGYPVGSIQLPDPSEPIVLLKDAVTCGGYATIATVISSDLNLLAQLKTHEKLKFKYVTIDEAIKARQETRDYLNSIREEIIQHN